MRPGRAADCLALPLANRILDLGYRRLDRTGETNKALGFFPFRFLLFGFNLFGLLSNKQCAGRHLVNRRWYDSVR